jgi:hypothetical protein
MEGVPRLGAGQERLRTGQGGVVDRVRGRSLLPLVRFARDKLASLRAAAPLYLPARRPIGRGLSVKMELAPSGTAGVTLREGIAPRSVRAYDGRCVEASPIYGVVLEQARLITDAKAFAALVTREGAIVDALSEDYRGRSGEYRSVTRLQRIPEVSRSGRCVSLLTGGGGFANYFHWLYDVLPRLHVLQQAEVLGADTTFLVPEIRHEFQRETLTRLGLGLDDCVSITSPVSISAPEFVASTGLRNHGYVEPWVLGFLRERFLSGAPGRSKRIYVNRHDADLRTIINEPELESALASLDVQSVSLSRLRFADQVQLFASADLIVAPHGAGLANLAFCRPGTPIIEIVGDGLSWPVYAQLARDIGLRYEGVDGMTIAASRVIPRTVRRRLGRVWDAQVDVRRVVEAVERAGQP